MNISDIIMSDIIQQTLFVFKYILKIMYYTLLHNYIMLCISLYFLNSFIFEK